MASLPANGSNSAEPVLLKQYKLLGAVIDAPWATRLDHKIARHVIERYYAKYGNARASLRYLEVATGAERNKIIPSLRRIIDNGVISIIRQGAGTRPTEYDLNFDFAKIASGAPEGTSTSGALEGTSSGALEGTSTGARGAPEGTQTYLRGMLTSMPTVSMNEDTPAVPTAPPVPGLEADTAASAVDPEARANDPFEELWTVYPRKHSRAKAKAAYKTLSPSPELHADLVAKAGALAAHYDTTATEKKWWKHMHTWLAEERYLEDLPEPYENPKEAAIARARENGPRKGKPQQAAKDIGLSPRTPIGRHRVKIVGFEITGDSFSAEQRFKFSYRVEDGNHEGKEFTHAFKALSADESAQLEGQAIYAQLRHATGILEPEDTTDFHEHSLWAIVGQMGRIEYAAL